MANVLKHRFASAKANGPDATQIQPSHWNDGHIFSGGNAGDLLTRDPTDASFGAKWAAPPAAPPVYGTWVDWGYSASYFLGNGGAMNWVVQSADQVTYGYALVGSLAFVLFDIQGSDVTGSPGTPFQMVLPGTFPTRSCESVCWAMDNGVQCPVRARVIAGDQVVRLYRLDGANWAVNVGNTAVSGQLILRV